MENIHDAVHKIQEQKIQTAEVAAKIITEMINKTMPMSGFVIGKDFENGSVVVYPTCFGYVAIDHIEDTIICVEDATFKDWKSLNEKRLFELLDDATSNEGKKIGIQSTITVIK